MCGISAVVSLRGGDGQRHHTNADPHSCNETLNEELTQKMHSSLDMIIHRGPDSRGIWTSHDGKVVLGHSRLSINDLSASGNQPLHSTDGTVHAIVNGEFYDFERLKANLTYEFGSEFTSSSDSELVIALYQAYGLDCVYSLRGEFAFCLFDEKKQLFVAVRDRYGIKPLLWTEQKGQLLVASEAKAFTPLDWLPEWDVKSIAEGGWNFDDRTLFKDVKKVRPGHYLTCDSSGHIEQHSYWDMDFPNKILDDSRSEAELIQGVRNHLVDAVRLRLRADVPIGIYLSGGIDSSVLAGIVTHLVNEQGQSMGSLPASDRVSCFSVAFEETTGFDESDVATRTADHLGVKQYKQMMNEEALASRFEDATWHCEHHNPDLNYVGKFALSELPQELGFKVVLTGEGADETMTGYHVFLPDFLREADLSWAGAMPDAERLRLLATSEASIQGYYESIGARFSVSDGVQRLNRVSTPAAMSAFMPDVFAPWVQFLDPTDSQDVIADDVPPAVVNAMQAKWHPINTAQYVWTKTHLPNQFMSCLGDRTEMAHSIEGRTPFLDHHLTEFINTVPPSLKMRWKGGDEFTSKWILREACKDFVTPEVYNRAKQPYTAPWSYREGGALQKLLQTLITQENVDQLGFVSWTECKGLLGKAFVAGDAKAARLAFVVAQWVILARRFGIKPAALDDRSKSGVTPGKLEQEWGSINAS